MRRFAPLLVCMAVLLAPAAAQGADQLYWTNFSGTFNNTIRGATSAGGAAGQTLYSGTDALDSESVAVDPAAGRLYWTTGDSKIQSAPLDGNGPVTTLYSGAAQGVGQA